MKVTVITQVEVASDDVTVNVYKVAEDWIRVVANGTPPISMSLAQMESLLKVVVTAVETYRERTE